MMCRTQCEQRSKALSVPQARSVFGPAILIAVPTLLGLLMFSARAELVKIPHGYHLEQANYYCGIASIQMLLDAPAVRNNNAAVNAYFLHQQR